jgi:thiol-disulfide isomerase/thioredoxin
MKQFGILAIALLVSLAALSQQKDSLPPYLRGPGLVPLFNIQLTDSTVFNTASLPKNKVVVITFFDPECGHCQEEAKALSQHMKKFRKVLFVMASAKEIELIREFNTTFGLDQYANIRIGKDTASFLPGYYRIRTTPFTAVYSKKGKLLKAFENGYTIEELKKLVR